MPRVNTAMLNRFLTSEFNLFGDFVMKNRRTLTPRIFQKELFKMKELYLENNSRKWFCEEADNLAQQLHENGASDLSGVIYSTLVKLCELHPTHMQKYAMRGLEVARSQGDNVHIVARLNDMRKLYDRTPGKFHDYINVLYAEEHYLRKLAFNYDEAIKTYSTIERKPATKEEYTRLLAFIQTEIAKLTWRRHPVEALVRFVQARYIFRTSGDKQCYIDYTNKMVRQVRQFIKHGESNPFSNVKNN